MRRTHHLTRRPLTRRPLTRRRRLREAIPSPSRSSSSSRGYSSSPSYSSKGRGTGSAYSSRSTSSVPRSYKPSTRSPSRSTSRGGRSRSRSTSPFPEEEVHVRYSSPPPPRRRVYYSNPRTSTVYYDTVNDAPSTVVVRSETDQAYINGLWSGRLEAATIVGLAAAAGAVGGEREQDENDEWSSDYTTELAETRELINELKEEHT